MKWAVLIARLIVGGVFLVFGLNFFLKFLEMPPVEGNAGQFVGLLYSSGYLKFVKVLEIIGGVILISGILVPVGITVLMPISINILLYEVLLVEKAGIGVALTGLLAFLIVGYWKAFANVFNPTIKPIGGSQVS
ncbi:MAG: hypothetical protein N2112_08545 [Gemmataceae bacterium]|jgi:uncharacterized membrane protein YphA (DoxX/SURF4 family)|nr:hypothetical protein [Gemmataceae bacterium]